MDIFIRVIIFPLSTSEPLTMKKKSRDLTKGYSVKQIVAKLRRLADGLEKGERFTIQIAGERIQVPKDAVVNIEHERDKSGEEIEFQMVWKRVVRS